MEILPLVTAGVVIRVIPGRRKANPESRLPALVFMASGFSACGRAPERRILSKRHNTSGDILGNSRLAKGIKNM
jgi:hypothetical protein